jgi:hypothetical protein
MGLWLTRHNLLLDAELLSHTQPCTAATRIILELIWAWGQWFAYDQAELRLSTTDALGYLWWTHTPSRLLTHEGFDMLILARVEGDHPEAPSRAQSRHRLWQGGAEGWQFVIHRHAQGHKDARRRMDMGRPGRPRDRPRYEFSEMTGTSNRGALALGHNRSRNALGPALPTQRIQDGLQMFSRRLVD